jgi:type 1 glutamine amidotransferase
VSCGADPVDSGIDSLRDGASGDAGESLDQTAPPVDAAATDVASEPFRVLIFSRTAAYRHDSIPAAVQALAELATTGGYVAEATEDPTRFSASNLAGFQVVVFLNTTGDVLDDGQQGAFENWMNAGGSYVGVHSACDTEYDWPFYGTLVGAYFESHPAVQTANVLIEVADHPAMVGIAPPWNWRDEWYDFRSNPRPDVTVLATVDESSYAGGSMGLDHPIVWAHSTPGGGRAFYTALGHASESYSDPTFRGHLVGGLRWAAGR